MSGQTGAATGISAVQYLSFRAGGEECAVELPRLREIVRYERLTRVPRAAACVRGVLNLRGTVVPVVDLAAGLGLPAAPAGPQTCIVIVELAIEGEATAMGLIADEVSQILELEADEIEPAPSFGTRIPAALLRGVGRTQDGFIPLLDLDRLLGPASLLGAGLAGAAASPREGAA